MTPAEATGVSGGERQRLGIARALLADRPILLLDEPTAHLDSHTATQLAADLLTVTAGRTTLIVTHRPPDFPGLPVITIDTHGRPRSDSGRSWARPVVEHW